MLTMKKAICLILYVLWAVAIWAQEEETAASAEDSTQQSSLQGKIGRSSSRSRIGQRGHFAWRSIIDTQNKNTSIEDFFDAYVADLVDVAKPGYKALPPEAKDEDSEEYADYYKQQGKLVPSTQPFDLAIKGEGFFRVTDEEGKTLYTRNGTFAPNEEGVLVNNDGHILDPELVIENINESYSVNAEGQLMLNKLDGPAENLYQFQLYMPADAAQVVRHNTAFDFSDVVEVPMDKDHRIFSRMLELSTTQAAKALVRMTKYLYELKRKNPEVDYEFKMYLTDFLLKQYALAANNPQELEKFGQLVENVAPSLVFSGGEDNDPADKEPERGEPIMIR